MQLKPNVNTWDGDVEKHICPKKEHGIYGVEAELPPHIYAISLLVDAYIITALVPGLKPEEFQIEIQDDILRLRAEAMAEEDKEG